MTRNKFKVSLLDAPYKMTDGHARAIREAIRDRATRLGIPEQTAFAMAFAIVVREALVHGVTPSVLRHNLETAMASTAEDITGRKVTL